ncbi:hypothetical protein N7G274_004375 [Stereocaulon virgatum]|uniref:Uncharacterized protein n=1 Tax=Stereocaulon virgatum TaxID=373712 RepID=A0ABR4ACP2_9LECA
MAMSPDLNSHYTFLQTLCEIERLVVTRAKMIDAYVDVCSIGRIIMKKIDVLVSSNVVVSKIDCLMHIERLAEASLKIRMGTETMKDCMEQSLNKIECNLHDGNSLHKIMELKLDALVKLAATDTESDRFFLSDRLVDLANKMMDFKIHSVISVKCSMLMSLSNVELSRPARGASQSSDDDEDGILTPNESDSVSIMASNEEISSKKGAQELPDALKEADPAKTAMSMNIQDRESRIRQLETELASLKTGGGADLSTTVSELVTKVAKGERVRKDQNLRIKGLESINSRLRDDYSRPRTELKNAHRSLGKTEVMICNPKTPLTPPETNSHHPEPIVVERSARKLPRPAGGAMPTDPTWQWPTVHSDLPKRAFTRGRESAGTRAYTFVKPDEHVQWTCFDGPTTFTAKAVPEESKPELWGNHSASDCDTTDG